MPLTPTTRASLLMRLCDSEDHEAWVEFVNLYEPVTYRSVRQRGLQDADARDVMQELLLVVSRSIGQWEPRKQHGSFRSWLRRVVRNLTVSWLRQCPKTKRNKTGQNGFLKRSDPSCPSCPRAPRADVPAGN